MIKQCLLGALLLLISDLCLAQLGIEGENRIITLESIVILPSRAAQSKLARLTTDETHDAAPVSDFGGANNAAGRRNEGDDSVIWGLIGNGIGFRKQF